MTSLTRESSKCIRCQKKINSFLSCLYPMWLYALYTQHNKDERHSSLEKYTSHFIWKGCVWEGVGDRTELQHTDPHSYGHQRFFPVLLGCSTGGLGAQPLWVLVFSTASYLQHVWSPTAQSGAWGLPLLGAGFLYRILSLTDWISCALSYIKVQRTPSSCWRHKLHSFNPSTVKVILCYSSTWWTSYLHRCISYFDSPAGS